MDLFFTNPWAMVAGGLLISSPIIIHLINRMRFKRIRWAAMEFLLKSQKRNRRRLIIEQLILLLLRIFIVLLLGFLLARLVWGASNAGQSAMHVVVLDDSLSMTDRWSANGENTNSFEQGKRLIKDIAKYAQQANGAQTMQVYLLSKLDDEPIFNQQLGDTSLEELNTALDSVTCKPTALHLNPTAGVVKAKELFEDAHQNKRVLHLVSDFRESDWVVGPDAKALNEEVDRLVESGANVTLVDTANPLRGENRLAQNHDNLAILDFRAESKVVAEGVPVEFTVVLKNYSPAKKATFLHIKVNGAENFEGAQPVPDIPANGAIPVKFTLSLAKMVKESDLGPPRDTDTPDEREKKRLADRQFMHLTAEIEGDAETGLRGDNIRDLVLEVRRKVPALVIDGNQGEGIGPGGDLYMMEVAFIAARSFEAEKRKLEDLSKINLDLYPTIYLLNVPTLDKDAAQKLDDYVKKGGSVVYFLGDKVNSTFYNTTLHTTYAGLFPVLLAAKPTDPLTEEERLARRREDQPKMLFPHKKDKIVETIANAEPVFRFVLVDRYWPTAPRFQWVTTPDEPVEELIDLPNRKDARDYAAQAQDLVKSAIAAATALAQAEMTNKKPNEAKIYENYPAALEEYQRQVRTGLGEEHLYEVSLAFDRMLNDNSNSDGKDSKKPKMETLWAEPSMKDIKKKIETFITTIRYGDPLVVSRKHGKGRVIACLTPAGTVTKWHDWSAGSMASATFPMFIMDMQRELTKQSDDLNHIVGEKLHFQFDPAKYKDSVELTVTPQYDLVGASRAVTDGGAQDQRPIDRKGSINMKKKDLGLELDFTNAREGGFYAFTFTRLDGSKESQTYAFNVDSSAESDLHRADREKLERNPASGIGSKRGVIRLIEQGSDLTGFKARIPDFSEKPWLFLLLLIILIAEQAMAVHLSFHMKGGEGAQAPPATGGSGAAKTSAAA